MKLFILLGLVAAASAGIQSASTQQNSELFKYSPTDEYTLPEDIDDDKPPVIFSGDAKNAKVVSFENKNQGKGKFKLNLKTQNGIELNQVGKLKDENTFVISGSYVFTGPDGKRYRTRYTADEFGYHPMTELDAEFPESNAAHGVNGPDSGNKGFKFLQQNLDDNNKKGGPLGGNGQIGDGYSYNKAPGGGLGGGAGGAGGGAHGAGAGNGKGGAGNGYNYDPPSQKGNGYDYPPPKTEYLPPQEPDRTYLPVY